MANRGGYRIGRKLQNILLDIDRIAIVGHDIVETSDAIDQKEKKILMKNYNHIRRIIKEVLKNN